MEAQTEPVELETREVEATPSYFVFATQEIPTENVDGDSQEDNATVDGETDVPERTDTEPLPVEESGAEKLVKKVGYDEIMKDLTMMMTECMFLVSVLVERGHEREEVHKRLWEEVNKFRDGLGEEYGKPTLLSDGTVRKRLRSSGEGKA